MNENETVQQEPSTDEREPSQGETAKHIADDLGETGNNVRFQIARIVKAIGRTAALSFLAKAQEIEAKGGMKTNDGSRRRSLGGVYFYLVYGEGIEKATGERLQRPRNPNKPKSAPKEKTAVAPPQPQIKWEERIEIINELMKERGTATTVKITLIGTFNTYKEQGTCTVGVMQASEKIPALPKGVPTPPEVRSSYVVYIGSKQWKGIVEAAKDKEDSLIIEGYPQIDSQKGVISVFATSVNSKKLMTAKREAQKSQA
jgi:Phosphorylated adapter RNA export protein, RNA-binding domain